MNKHHELKIEHEYADDIVFHGKNFEVRFNDRGYQKGDSIIFKCILNGSRMIPNHMIEERKYIITYVHSGLGLNERFVVLGIKEQQNEQ